VVQTEKIGILDHSRDVHGEEYLKSEEVRQLLEQNHQNKNENCEVQKSNSAELRFK
jgi:hypothetical protein